MVLTYDLQGLHAPQEPSSDAVAVTPADADLANTPTRGLYVGTTGNMKVTMYGGIDKDGNAVTGQAVTFNTIPAGAILPLRVVRVWSTGTTASNIIALY